MKYNEFQWNAIQFKYLPRHPIGSNEIHQDSIEFQWNAEESQQIPEIQSVESNQINWILWNTMQYKRTQKWGFASKDCFWREENQRLLYVLCISHDLISWNRSKQSASIKRAVSSAESQSQWILIKSSWIQVDLLRRRSGFVWFLSFATVHFSSARNILSPIVHGCTFSGCHWENSVHSVHISS